MDKRKALLSALAVVALGAGSATGQQTTGAPGSPAATTTLQGDQLPRPTPKFGGTIERNAAQSKPYWPARVTPPKAAPNVLLIMTDDAGFGVTSTFGGVIPTPALDRIAKNGLRYTNFNSTALCSPTRARAAGHGDFLAEGDHGQGRHPQPVPPHDRRGADDPRGRQDSPT